MKKILYFLVLIVVIIASGLFITTQQSFKNLLVDSRQFLAGVFFVDSITEEEIKESFSEAQESADTKVRILIAAGHDETSPGTRYRNLKEVDLTALVAEQLYDLLSNRSEFETFLLRDSNGYTTEFKKHFEENKDKTLEYREAQKKIMDELIKNGQIIREQPYTRNSARSDVATRLYGVNTWANENDIDIVIHIHFNHYRDTKLNQRGEYSGLSIYVPESQYSNAKTSLSVTRSVYDQLTVFFAPSDLPLESSGIIEDQDLISIGSFNTLDSVSMLIEYGYIYEGQFTEPEVRDVAMRELAQQTYNGIMNYFNNKETSKDIIASLPFQWNRDLYVGTKYSADTYALQLFLTSQGLYPPKDKTKNDCPISGYFGNCTQASVKQFQKDNNIEPASGRFGILTRTKADELYTQ